MSESCKLILVLLGIAISKFQVSFLKTRPSQTLLHTRDDGLIRITHWNDKDNIKVFLS